MRGCRLLLGVKAAQGPCCEGPLSAPLAEPQRHTCGALAATRARAAAPSAHEWRPGVAPASPQRCRSGALGGALGVAPAAPQQPAPRTALGPPALGHLSRSSSVAFVMQSHLRVTGGVEATVEQHRPGEWSFTPANSCNALEIIADSRAPFPERSLLPCAPPWR